MFNKILKFTQQKTEYLLYEYFFYYLIGFFQKKLSIDLYNTLVRD